MRIAVVDDMLILLEKLEQSLADSFQRHRTAAEIVGFQSAEAFLQMHEENPFQAVFLDIYLPEMDGFEAAKILRNKNKRILIVFCTSDDSAVYDAFKYQPFRFLRKMKIDAEMDEIIEALISELRGAEHKLVIKTANGMTAIPTRKLLSYRKQRALFECTFDGRHNHLSGSVEYARG